MPRRRRIATIGLATIGLAKVGLAKVGLATVGLATIGPATVGTDVPILARRGSPLSGTVTAMILLIRHAAHAHVGSVLSGRQPDLPLTEAGRRQAAALAQRLRGEPLAAIFASPVLRAQQTAAELARTSGVPLQTAAAIEEIDFGGWTGKAFSDLAHDPHWRAWNSHRATTRPPGGESMVAAQARMIGHIDATAVALHGRTVAMVSHCDMIRGAIAHYLGLPLGRMLDFDVDVASVSRLAVAEGNGRLVTLNERLQ